MTKPDLPISKNIILWSLVAILVTAGIITLTFAFGGPDENAATEINAVYTNAASTLAAQQATLLAGQLSATPTVSMYTPTASLTPLSGPTNTLPVFATSTSSGVTTGGCDNSAYVSDVTIPDGTVIAPGQAFTKTWKVQNTGTCTWTATYQIILIAGEGMGGKATAIGSTVSPGQSVDVSVALTAPTTVSASNITGTWRLSNDKSQPFGTTLTVVIKVGAVTGTVSVTPTATTGSSGPTNTPTFTPTFTVPAPTETPSLTPTPETPPSG
jgi:hypothetical protein